MTGAVKDEGVLNDASRKIIEKKANKFILVDPDNGKTELTYRERSEKLFKYIHEPQVYKVMVVLHEMHGHFSDQITIKRCICCPAASVGPIRLNAGCLPTAPFHSSFRERWVGLKKLHHMVAYSRMPSQYQAAYASAVQNWQDISRHFLLAPSKNTGWELLLKSWSA